jgi:P4 family phage/plasmid primase-like protien
MHTESSREAQALAIDNPWVSAYWAAGWYPLPASRDKQGVPSGVTGKRESGSHYPSLEETVRWRFTGNLALRMPPNVVGVDVDHYETSEGVWKLGGDELKRIEEEVGVRHPRTWSSTSRGSDQPSRISFYLVPEHVFDAGLLKDPHSDIELIQPYYRYSMAAPSVHRLGTDVKWYRPDGSEADEFEVPQVDDLPELPEELLAYYMRRQTKAGQTYEADTDRDKPGTDYNFRVNWHELLTSFELTLIGSKTEKAPGTINRQGKHVKMLLREHWCRPIAEGENKDSTDTSATVTYLEDGMSFLTVHTNSLKGFDGSPKNAFEARTILAFGKSDEETRSEMAHILRLEGYGKDDLEAAYPGEDVGNALLFVEKFGKDFKHVYEWKTWLWWNGKFWQRDQTQHALAAQKVFRVLERMARKHDPESDIAKFLKRCARKAKTSNGITALLALARPHLAVTPDSLNQNHMLFNVMNGTIELGRQTILRSHRKEDLITTISPWRYNQDAECPTWEKFLLHAQGESAEMVQYIQKIVGYCMTGEVSDKSFFIFHGPSDTGKSKFSDAVYEMLGRDYAVVLPQEALLARSARGGNNDEIAALFGKRLASMSETPEGAKLDGAKAKHLTGGGRITAMRKFEHMFTFDPTHKLFMDTNYKPVIRGDDQAVWNRVRLVPFEVVIPKAQQDLDLPKKLTAEMEGILAWAVRGYTRYVVEGLNPPEVVTEATQTYRQDQDELAKWIDECCDLDPQARESLEKLYRSYSNWAKAGNLQADNRNVFTDHLKARGIQFAKVGGKAGRQGLKLRPAPIVVTMSDREASSVPATEAQTAKVGNSRPFNNLLPS